MGRLPWLKIFLVILLTASLFGLWGCQVTKNLDNYTRALSSLPSRLGQVFINLMGGIGDVGSALANQVGNIVNNMTGH